MMMMIDTRYVFHEIVHSVQLKDPRHWEYGAKLSLPDGWWCDKCCTAPTRKTLMEVEAMFHVKQDASDYHFPYAQRRCEHCGTESYFVRDCDFEDLQDILRGHTVQQSGFYKARMRAHFDALSCEDDDFNGSDFHTHAAYKFASMDKDNLYIENFYIRVWRLMPGAEAVDRLNAMTVKVQHISGCHVFGYAMDGKNGTVWLDLSRARWTFLTEDDYVDIDGCTSRAHYLFDKRWRRGER